MHQTPNLMINSVIVFILWLGPENMRIINDGIYESVLLFYELLYESVLFFYELLYESVMNCFSQSLKSNTNDIW